MGKNVKSTLGVILKGYPRISETFISNEILLLESLGFNIHIISMRRPRESFTHKSVEQIQAGVDYLPSTILKHFFSLMYHNIGVLVKHPSRYLNALKIAGKRWLRTRKSATLKHLLQAGYTVNKLLPGKNIVHFQAHFAHSPTSVAMFTSILSGRPFSFFAHAKDIYTSHPDQLREKIDKARFVVTCTQYNRQFLSEVAPKSSTPIFCTYHGINLDYFSPGDRDLSCQPPYQLLTVARMTQKKGLDTIYKALAILKGKGIRFSHALIGKGDDHDKVLELRKDLGLEAETQLCGTLAHEDVIEYYKKSDLFVLGCRIADNGDRDGIPNVMAESMAMKLPVVATDVSGIPEFLENNVTGKMVASENPEALADAIIALLEDHALRRQVADNARKRIEACFNNQELIKVLSQIYIDHIPELNLDAVPTHPPVSQLSSEGDDLCCSNHKTSISASTLTDLN